MAVPDACKEVFAEAAKDRCFGRAAQGVIAGAPLRWLARMPAKVRMTFDYFGAAPLVPPCVEPRALSLRREGAAGRARGAGVTSPLARRAPCRAQARGTSAARARGGRPGSASSRAFCPPARSSGISPARSRSCCSGGGRSRARRCSCLATAIVILATAATHAVFFGSGRIGLVVVPFVTALAFLRPARSLAEPISVRGA